MENKQIIINIGRQVGSGGCIIAEHLATEFGCRMYDKELLNLAAKESGFSEKFFEHNDEHKTFFQSFFDVQLPLLGENNFFINDFSQDHLYLLQSEAIQKAAESGNCVFVGRTADYVLRNHKNVVNLFIAADMGQRVERVCKRTGMTKEAAQKFIRNREEQRASYYNYYTGKRWGCAESYDLSINTSLLGIEATERLLANFVRYRFGLPIGKPLSETTHQ